MLDQPAEQMRRVDTFDCPIWKAIHRHMFRRQHGDVRIFKVQAHEEWETFQFTDQLELTAHCVSNMLIKSLGIQSPSENGNGT